MREMPLEDERKPRVLWARAGDICLGVAIVIVLATLILRAAPTG